MKEKIEKKIEKTASLRGFEEEYISLMGNFRDLFTSASNAGLVTLYDTLKKSPEVMACLTAIVEDILADGYQFIGSQSAIKKTEKFVIESNFFKILADGIFDFLITGNAYILKLSVNSNKVDELVSDVAPSILSAFKTKKIEKEAVYELINQNFKIPRDLQILKASTMIINFDETGKVLSYEQKVNGKNRLYRPQDIIHISDISIGGNPYGFSKLEPLLSDIATLIFAKEYLGKYFENDGVPSFIFKMPNEHPDSPNYKALKKELKEFKQKQNKFRGMVLTGEVEPIILDKLNKDMEFGRLIQHFTQLILMALGVPSHRVHYVLSEKTQGSQTNRAYEGYYKKIRFLQSLFENSLNKDLFEVFNTELRFYGAYRIDEMRQAQIVQILSQIGAISIEEARELMNLPRELVGIKTNKVGDDLKIDFNEDKRREQGRDNNPEAEMKIDNKLKEYKDELDKKLRELDNKIKELKELKELKKKEIEESEKVFISFKNKKAKEINIKDKSELIEKVKENNPKTINFVEVSLPLFVYVVEKIIPFHKAKILYEETNNGLYLYFNDGHWKYRTFVKTNNPKKYIDDNCPFAMPISFS